MTVRLTLAGPWTEPSGGASKLFDTRAEAAAWAVKWLREYGTWPDPERAVEILLTDDLGILADPSSPESDVLRIEGTDTRPRASVLSQVRRVFRRLSRLFK